MFFNMKFYMLKYTYSCAIFRLEGEAYAKSRG